MKNLSIKKRTSVKKQRGFQSYSLQETLLNNTTCLPIRKKKCESKQSNGNKKRKKERKKTAIKTCKSSRAN